MRPTLRSSTGEEQRGQPDQASPRAAGSVALAIVAITLVWTLGAYSLSLVSPDVRLVASGGLACLIVSLPTLRRDFRWVSPWTMILLATFVGCGLRTAAVVSRGLVDPMINRLYLRGHDLEVVDRYSWLYLSGLAVLSIAYALLASRPGRRRSRSDGSRYEFGPYAWVGIAILASVGAAGLYFYVQATAGPNSDFLSAKRSIYMRDSNYQGSHGLLRTINSFSGAAFYLAIALVASKRSSSSGEGVTRWLILLVLFINATALDFYSSTRAQIAYTMLGAAVLYSIIRGSLPRRVFLLVGAAGAGLMAWLTILRQASQGASVAISPSTMAKALTDGLILNRNFTEIFKSVNIMDAVPRLIPFSNGSTITNYLLAFVPRSVWSDKPIIDPGVAIGVRVYGTDGTSIPPGLIAESYWAFGIGGVFLGSVLAAYGLAWIESKYLRDSSLDLGRATIYSYVWFPIGGVALGGAIGNSLMAGAISLTTIWFALRWCGHWRSADEND